MIHGLLFWLDERVSRNIGPLISRVLSGPPLSVVRTSAVCCPDLRRMLSGPMVWVVGTDG
jgi:hypothetical protein